MTYVDHNNWMYAQWPNFKPEELQCKHTGKLKMSIHFMDRLQKLRSNLGFPLKISSGYRHETHPVEASKSRPGVHTKGVAVDISCGSKKAYDILKEAFYLGFTGIGVSQKGNTRFIHLDTYTKPPRSNVWSY